MASQEEAISRPRHRFSMLLPEGKAISICDHFTNRLLVIADILKIEIVTLGIVFYIQCARVQVDIYWPTLHTFGIIMIVM